MRTRSLTRALLAVAIVVLATLPWLSTPRRAGHARTVAKVLPSGTGDEARPGTGLFRRDPRELLLYDKQGLNPSEVRMRAIEERMRLSVPR
jgi:hypothetical protein